MRYLWLLLLLLLLLLLAYHLHRLLRPRLRRHLLRRRLRVLLPRRRQLRGLSPLHPWHRMYPPPLHLLRLLLLQPPRRL